MKHNLYFIICLLLVSCNKSFLDKKPVDSTEQDMLLQNIEGVKSSLIGAYSQLQSPTYYGRNFIIIQDIYTDNAEPSAKNSGQYNNIYSWQVNENDDYLKDLWKTAYNIISNCNNIIESTSILKNNTPLENDIIIGEAKAIRALVYFDLVRMFSQTYTTPASSGVLNANSNGGHIGIPIITSKTNRDSLLSLKRNTVFEVYTQIENDLLSADTLLSQQEISNFRFNSRSVESLLAIMYLHKHEYNSALTYAENVIYNYDYGLIKSDEYINSWLLNDTEESIFSINMSESDYAGTNSLGHMLSPKAYGAISPSQDYTSSLETTDLRNELLQKENILFSTKYPGRLNTLGLDNIPVIRLSELYLIQAECYAEKAKTVNGYTFAAQQSLLSIASRANESIHAITSTGDELMQSIHNEYRKEFLFEGKRLFQIKRIHADIQRGECANADCILSKFDYRFAFPIPLAETNANDSIIQNQGY